LIARKKPFRAHAFEYTCAKPTSIIGRAQQRGNIMSHLLHSWTSDLSRQLATRHLAVESLTRNRT
jgi:hypothetical protein